MAIFFACYNVRVFSCGFRRTLIFLHVPRARCRVLSLVEATQINPHSNKALR